MHLTRTLKTTIPILAAVALLAAVGTSHAATLYLNTFDDTGNINIGSDETDGTDFFNNKPSNPPASITDEPFDTGVDTNIGDMPASGEHVTMTIDPNSQATFEANRSGSNRQFNSVIDAINEMPAGTYDLTLSFDYATNLTSARTFTMNLQFMFFSSRNGDSGGNARWETSKFKTPGFGSPADPTVFGTFTHEYTFTLVDNPTGTLPEGHFAVGTFNQFELQMGFDTRATETTTAVFDMDNLRLSSQTIPEPASLALLGIGGAAMLCRRRQA